MRWGGDLSREEKEAVRAYGLSGRVSHFPSPSPQQLSSLYHFSSVFCYPSLYEGFGFPLLEAFACGCPVAASSTSSIPEVAGEAAEYFEPLSADSIRIAIERVLTDQSHARKLSSAGTSRLSSFSWKDSALKTLEVYREAS